MLQRIESAPLANVDVEQAVLGGILINDEAYSRVAPFLASEHFYDPVHGRIYATMAARIAQGELVDARSIKSYLRIGEDIGSVSVSEYVSRLANEAAPVSMVEGYGRLIRDLSVRRRLADVARDAEQLALEASPDEPVAKLLERIEGDFASLRESHRVHGADLSLRGDLQSALNAASDAYQRATPAGWPWFMADIDRVLGMRIEPGNLYGILGASGDGKTSFVLQQGRFGVERLDANGNPDPIPFLFLSGEQSKEQCIWQMHVQHLSRQAELGHCTWAATNKAIRDGQISEVEFDLMVDDAERLRKLPIAIQKWSGLRVSELGVRIRQFVKRHGPCIAAIDNSKKVQPEDPRANFADKIFQIGEGLKDVAAETGSAIMLLSHRNSDFLERRNMRPVRGDMYGKENALNNLDACLALFRAERWLREKRAVAESEKERDRLTNLIEGDPSRGRSGERGKADFYTLKARFGEEGGSRKVRFIDRFTRFAPMEREDQRELPV
jgi:replicative DNA helicase